MTRNKKFIISFFTILFLVIGVFCYFNFNSKSNDVSAAADWLTGWTYRKPITINNNVVPSCTVSSGLTCAVTTSDGYVINTFTGSGTWTAPAGINSVEYLVVGGGGGGGGYSGGGGGGGGVLTGTLSVTSESPYTVTVGAGGTGGYSYTTQAGNGGNSVFFDKIAIGGGYGGGTDSSRNGNTGGSGGGSRYGGIAGSGTSGQGNAGGTGFNPGIYGGGGGGGAGGMGSSATATVAGNGGIGLISFTGSYYGGGGGGGGLNGGTAGVGVNGGGNGSLTGNGSNGSNGTGGGGGGANGSSYSSYGGSGGSGTVIIRYLAPALTNYQTKITVPYVSGMKADFSDLRFTSSDGTTELSYWIESYTASTSAVAWVKVPSLVSGSNTIYMYYGNSSATTTSSGDNTFVFFDDFTGTAFDITKWDTLNSPAVSGGYALFRSTSAAWQAILSKYTASDTRNYQIYVRYKIVNTSEQRLFHGWSNVTAPSSNYPACSYMYGYNRLYATYGTTSYVSFAFALGTWYTAKHNLNSSYYQTVTLVENGSATVTSATAYNSTINKVFLGTVYGGGDVDWIFVKSYTSTEPTVTIGGEENLVSGCGTGGTVTKVNGYCIHQFTTVGTSSWVVPTGVTSVEYLVVAGGGAGGSYMGGGGGAGGFRVGTGYSVTPNSSVTITVGAGGVGGLGIYSPNFNVAVESTSGGNSVFGSITSIGGGYGSAQVAASGGTGGSGGSGGGGSAAGAGTGIKGSGTSGQGNDGGAATAAHGAAGGGGGSSSVGGSTTSLQGGAGGAGSTSTITGSTTYYCGGGGGGGATNAIAGTAAANYGGGNGSNIGNGSAATGYGSGGGGANADSSGGRYGGSGGSGIVIIKYAELDTTSPVVAQVTAVPSTTIDTTPNYTFSSTEAGAITYGGDCSSSTTSAVSGNNTITFNALTEGTHSNCTIKVADSNSNISNTLSVNSFTITGPIVYSNSDFSCSVSSDCGTGTAILNLSDYLGEHAELSTQSYYPYKVCCSGTGMSNSCSATNHATVLRLSDVTNAHVEENTQITSAYNTNKACLSSATKAVFCTYGTTCPANYVCLASISDITNAHIGDCSAYSIKACCTTIVPVNSCVARAVATPIVTKAGTVLLCADADITNPSDSCYSACWKGTGGTPDLTSSNWKCSTCKDLSNNTVSCLSTGTPFAWTLSGGHSSSSDYTIVSGDLGEYKAELNFTTLDNTRKASVSVGSGLCSGYTASPSPKWKEVSPF